uniref:G-protein coupled receptors family 1 profile domain-containing protein n=1 Tax=Romanomermis culicivorax TaxID=13658 RepID=A0A915J085_ROMCU
MIDANITIDINSTFIDFSTQLLREQLPAFWLWIFLTLINGFSSVISSTIFLKYKFRNSESQFMLLNQLFLEFCDSFWSFGLAIWHIMHISKEQNEAMTSIICYKYVAFQNFTIDGSSLFSFILGLDRFLAIKYPLWYKSKNVAYKFLLVFLAYIFQSSIFVASFFDHFDPSPLPVCIVRAATGYYLTLFKSYYLMLINISPLVFYITIYLLLTYQAGHKIDDQSNLRSIKRKLSDKVMRAMTFITIWHTLTFAFASFSTLILNKLPYRGSQYGPYFLAFYYTNGTACFLSYTIYVKRFRQCLKHLIFKQSLIDTSQQEAWRTNVGKVRTASKF